MTNKLVQYKPVPTLKRFHGSDAFVRCIMGPRGSSKSVGCCWEIFTRAQEQAPDYSDSVRRRRRRTRWAVIRDTYPNLTATTIKTFTEWFPPSEFGSITYSAPITYKMEWTATDGSEVECEVLFVSMENHLDVSKVLSLELTGAWINEAKDVTKEVFDAVQGSLGRYPAKKDAPYTWSGMIADTNPPSMQHWFYDLAEGESQQNMKFYRQPGALMRVGKNVVPNPQAENVENQPKGYNYWLDMSVNKSKEWIDAYILSEYAAVQAGKPVYEQDYIDSIHCSEDEMVAIQSLPILLCWDFGLTPTCIVMQLTQRGQLRILDEIIGDNIGIKRFATEFVQPFLHQNYRDIKFESVGDPAGAIRERDEKSVFDELREVGLPTESAPSNAIAPRLESVRWWLGMSNRFKVNKRCRVVREGFIAGYKYRQLKVSGNARYSDTPDKNEYSHPHDAVQYGCLKLRKELEKPVRIPGAIHSPMSIADTTAGY